MVDRINGVVLSGGRLDLRERLTQVRHSRLVRQNLILFSGGLIAGIGGFVYHAIAGRVLGPATYGQVAFLIALYAVGTAPALILVVVLARYTATLAARGDAGISSLLRRTSRLIAIPCLVAILFTALLARPVANFEHLGSTIPVLILGFSIALIWQVAIPRGILQGLQRFTALSLNLSLELVVRTVAVVALLAANYAVSGAMAAVLLGLMFAFALGLFSLRDHFARTATRVHLRVMAGFSLTAAWGIIGVQILYNQDVILAEHYLSSHAGGIYGGLNKIGTILYFLTLSVSQVLFPRVVEAVAKEQHPGRILLYSAGILTLLGSGALLVFGVLPGLVVGILFGPSFRDAVPYVFAVGVIGLALSLDNLLVQFFMAVHDRVFLPILALGVVAEGGAIVLFHSGVGQVVGDVVAALVGLLVLLAIRCYLLLPTLRASSLAEPEAKPALG
ncbi:MAG TPA: oligosaccharide flippase family protein [Candidatus Dormibacteraeota bacterium]|nr:oligosaccharide flippase family protein [Candidatus Dormibacteraeota bacterium]